MKQGVGGVPPKPFTAQGVRIGDYKIRRLGGGKLWMENAEGEGGVFQEDGLRAAIDSFWAGSF